MTAEWLEHPKENKKLERERLPDYKSSIVSIDFEHALRVRQFVVLLYKSKLACSVRNYKGEI